MMDSKKAISPGEEKQEAGPRPLVLAFIEDHPKAIMVLRTARRRAQEKGAKWRVVYLETPAIAVKADEGAQERMLRQLTLATQMGGESAHIEAETLDAGFRRLLETEKERLVLCVVGNTEAETWWQRWQHRRTSFWQNVIRMANDYSPVEIVPLTGQPFARSAWLWPRLRNLRVRNFAYSLLAVAVAYSYAELLRWLLPPAMFRVNSQNVALLFMIACAFAAGRYGLLPGIVASIAGFLSMNYFFTPPYHTIQITSVTDFINMALFLSAAVLISLFNSQTREYAERAARRELSTQALFTLYRIASNAFTRQQALEKLQSKLTRMLEMEVAFFLPPALNPSRVDPSYPADLQLDENDRKALDACWSDMKVTGLASPFNPGTQWRFEPMMAPGGEIGVIGIRPLPGRTLEPWYGRLLSAIADQTATILEHIELERSMEATRIREEREKLRSMLLSSVSHDLKTPLAGIIGSLSVVQSLGDRLPPVRRMDLLDTALEEGHRLDSFITNILDMTRLESGRIEFRQEWHDMPTVIQQVSKRLQHRLRRHPLEVHPVPIDIEINMDIMMTEQILQNLIDNACKYTPAGTRIEILCHAEERGFIIEVRDHGEGVPDDKLTQIFDKYARLKKEDAQVAGTGLGLSICKMVMESQGGSITAANHPEGGAVFTLCLPQWRKREIPDKYVA